LPTDRFEALFEAIGHAVALFDAKLELASANPRYYELTGLSPDDALGRSVYDAFPNAHADFTEQVETAGLGTPIVGFPVEFQHPAGQRLVEVTFVPIMGEAGAQGLIVAGTDITEREELRQDLARSIAQLEAIFDVIPDSVRVVDAEGNTRRTNTQAQLDHAPDTPTTLRELWQLDRPRALDGTSLFVHEHPTARALRGEAVRGERLEVRRGPDASMIIDVNANPLYDERGRIRGAVTVERDVTFRTQLQQQLEAEALRTAELYERVSTEAERLERMVQERTQELLALQEGRARERRLAAVGQLAAGVMHDVNNALNPIMAAAYLLEMHAEDPAAVRDYAVRIAKAAETGAATAARVGRFIRQEPMAGERYEMIDLAVVTDEVVAMTRPLWAERTRGGPVQLERTLAPGAKIRGVPGEIREALLNLVQNALDAMQGGGTLGLVARVSGEEVTLEVRDTGNGMSEEVRERAFEPFFTTKGSAGTGLGLAEVYGIARRHRGRAEIESVEGAGTTVRLVFPLGHDVATTPEAPPPAQHVPRRVLLVEDHAESREFMQALLESDGHGVDTVATVADATARLGDGEEPPYDVLVTDIGLPDGSGWDLVRHARGRWPKLRVGVVTGWEPRGNMGPIDFLLRKPVRTSDLLKQVALPAGSNLAP
jgi:PAS domain S-box-containing protein